MSLSSKSAYKPVFSLMFLVRTAPYDAGKILFLKTITPIHAGVGRTYGEAVDLPIQRDEFGIPVIWGSSLKGVLRAQSEQYAKVQADAKVIKAIKAVFGPDDTEESRGIESASSISVLDAKLVLIPARSLRGLYAYVTSSHLLRQYRNYVDIVKSCTRNNSISKFLEQSLDTLIREAEKLNEGKVIMISDKCILDVGGSRKVVLNEQIYDADIRKDLHSPVSECFRKVLTENDVAKLVIVSDYDIQDIIRTSIQVITRVKLNYDRKTVQEGPWTEEYLPSGSILVTAILYSKPRILRLCENSKREGLTDNMRKLCEELNDYKNVDKIMSEIILPGNRKYLILGGHETIGKGIVQVETL